MSEVDDPYVVLGVDRNANEKEIKRAYRFQAKLNHPDLHCGKPEIERNAFLRQFQRVQWAFDLLSDPEEREYYDAHGKIRSDERSRVLNPVEKAIAQALADLINPTIEVTQVDWVQQLRTHFNGKLRKLQGERERTAYCVRKLKPLLGRFTRDGEPVNPLATVIESQLKNLEAEDLKAQDDMAHLERCMKELEHYSFSVETVPLTQHMLNGYNMTYTRVG